MSTATHLLSPLSDALHFLKIFYTDVTTMNGNQALLTSI